MPDDTVAAEDIPRALRNLGVWMLKSSDPWFNPNTCQMVFDAANLIEHQQKKAPDDTPQIDVA
jgi:hypothetical protein